MNAKEIEIDAVADRGEVIASAIIEHVENAGRPLGRRDHGPAAAEDSTSRPSAASGRSAARSPGPSASPGPSTSSSSPRTTRSRSSSATCGPRGPSPSSPRSRGRTSSSSPSRPCWAGPSRNGKIDPRPRTTSASRRRSSPSPGSRGPTRSSASRWPRRARSPASGDDIHEAFLKALLSAGFRLPRKNVLLTIGGETSKHRFLEPARKLHGDGAPPLRDGAHLELPAAERRPQHPALQGPRAPRAEHPRRPSPGGRSISSSPSPTRRSGSSSTPTTACGAWPSISPSPS